MGDRDPLDYCTFGEEEAKDTRTFRAYLQIWYGNNSFSFLVNIVSLLTYLLTSLHMWGRSVFL